MDIATKKLVFRQLISRIFNDKDQSHITEDNYKEFYQHILTEMKDQSTKYTQINNEEKYFFFEAVIDIFENFSTLSFFEIKDIIFSRKSFIHYVAPKIPVEISLRNYNNYMISLECKYRLWTKEFSELEGKN